jgi:hypothetical protein
VRVTEERVCRGLAATLLGAAWGGLGYGLFLSPADREAWGDLEAGGRLGANLLVYLPYLALTLPVVLVMILGLLRSPIVLVPQGVMAVGVALFAWWVSTQEHLFSAQPQLLTSIAFSLLADVGSAAVLVGAWAIAREMPKRRPASGARQ